MDSPDILKQKGQADDEAERKTGCWWHVSLVSVGSLRLMHQMQEKKAGRRYDVARLGHLATSLLTLDWIGFLLVPYYEGY